MLRDVEVDTKLKITYNVIKLWIFYWCAGAQAFRCIVNLTKLSRS